MACDHSENGFSPSRWGVMRAWFRAGCRVSGVCKTSVVNCFRRGDYLHCVNQTASSVTTDSCNAGAGFPSRLGRGLQACPRNWRKTSLRVAAYRFQSNNALVLILAIAV